MIVPVELMYFVMSSNAFRERTCNTRANGHLMKAVREGPIILRFERHKLGRSRVCCDVGGITNSNRKFQ